MTPKKLAQSFEVFAGLIRDPLEAQSVAELGQGLKDIKLPKGVKFAEYVGNCIATWRPTTADQLKPTVGQIADAIEPLHRLLAIALSSASLSQVNQFLDLLQQHREMSFSVFLSRIGLGADEASNEATHYIESLQSAISDPEAFAVVIKRIKNDKDLSAEDLSMIASGFTGLRKKWSRKGAIDSLVAKQSAYLRALSSFGDANGKSAA